MQNPLQAEALTEIPTETCLYLIPTVLAEGTEKQVLSPQIEQVIRQCRLFFVENLRTARRFVSRIGHPKAIESLQFFVLDKNTSSTELTKYIQLCKMEGLAGIISEAGCPGVADPGANLVAIAHYHKIKVVPLVGPCSFILALMASGLNGQGFSFIGYLPQKTELRQQAIRKMEKEISDTGRTLIFMETPYRNKPLFADLLKFLRPEIRLCVALNLTSADAFTKTHSIADWNKTQFVIADKLPAVFLLGK